MRYVSKINTIPKVNHSTKKNPLDILSTPNLHTLNCGCAFTSLSMRWENFVQLVPQATTILHRLRRLPIFVTDLAFGYIIVTSLTTPYDFYKVSTIKLHSWCHIPKLKSQNWFDCHQKDERKLFLNNVLKPVTNYDHIRLPSQTDQSLYIVKIDLPSPPRVQCSPRQPLKFCQNCPKPIYVMSGLVSYLRVKK